MEATEVLSMCPEAQRELQGAYSTLVLQHPAGKPIPGSLSSCKCLAREQAPYESVPQFPLCSVAARELASRFPAEIKE
jgi:hypothetical protein